MARRKHKSREGTALLREAVDGGTEVVDGRTFKKVLLPEQAPPAKRSHTSRYHLFELRGEGKPSKKRRRKSKSRRQNEQQERNKRVT